MLNFSSLEDAKETLSSLFLGKKIVLFVGAGISYPQPSGIPLADQTKKLLLSLILDEAGVNDEKLREIVDSRFRLETFLQALTLRLGDFAFRPFDEFECGEPNLFHNFIAGLAERELIGTVLTTNFDCLIEKALSRKKIDYQVYCYPQDWNLHGKSKVRLLKLHGSTANPSYGIDKRSLVATVNRASMPLIPKIRDQLYDSLHGSIILYIGYSGRDYYDIYPLLFSLKHEYAIWIDHTDLEQFETKRREQVWQGTTTRGYVERVLFVNGDGILLKCNTGQLIELIAERLSVEIPNCRKSNNPLANLNNWAKNIGHHSLAVLGDLYVFCSEPHDSIPYFEKYLEHYLARNNELDSAYAARKLGMVYEEIGDFESAEKYYSQGLELYVRNAKLEDELTLLSDIALLYYEKGDLVRSLDICERCVSRMNLEGIESPPISATLNLCLGNIKLRVKEFASAIEYYGQAKLDFERSQNPPGGAMVSENIAYTYMVAGRSNEAIKFAEDAIFFYGTPLQPRHGNQIRCIQVINLYATNLLAGKGYSGAINYVFSSNLIKEMGVVREMVDAIELCNGIKEGGRAAFGHDT